MKTRNIDEYPALLSFARTSSGITLLTLLAFLGWSAVTFAPSAHSFEVKSGLTLLWILIAFATYSVRTITMAVQCKRGQPQTFDRSCPEYVTVSALLLFLVTIFWRM